MEKQISFVNVAILWGDSFEVHKNTSLTIENGKISHIGPPLENSQKYDLGGKLLCPMFINSHTHLGDTGAKELGSGLPMEKVFVPPDGMRHRFLNQLKAENQTAMMHHGLIEMLRNGVIACADFREQGVEGINMLRKAAEGLPILPIILGRMKEVQDLTQLIQETHEILEIADGLGIRHIASYSRKFLQGLRERMPDKILAFHVDELSQYTLDSLEDTAKSEARRAVDFGANIIVHLVHTPRPDLEYVARNNVSVVACPRSNSIQGEGIPNLSVWKKCGLPFALGTDYMMLSSPDMMREMDAAGRTACGLSMAADAMNPLTLLQAATINGAKALQLDQRLGSLAPGKEASFICFNLNSPNLIYSNDLIASLVYRAGVTDIAGVFIQGKWLQEWLK